ncbi:MAG TPA: AAA family ATPase, partial [Geobacteraceae bacterium]|nr:AAA family ATPase [Geobacteraceae bacterium]
MTQHIAIYGRGGAGKSTLASNLAAALAEIGQKVVLVGCDPTGDSTVLLHGEKPRPSVIELLRAGERPSVEQLVTEGYRGTACIEVGDPFLIGECAALGIGRAITLLLDLDAFDRL